MQKDFHYYATYCAAYIAGYNHEESLTIAYSAQFVDLCSRTLLAKIKGPEQAATTQLQLELMDIVTNVIELQDITRIWSSFHFLPYDLYAEKKAGKKYRNKYRLICNVNGDLLVKTVELARGKSLQAAGLAMHVLADTWAHRYFAGTPSLVINNTTNYFYELLPEGEGYIEKPVVFKHNPMGIDDIDHGVYINSLYQYSEDSIMNLGHGRAGHLPDYSFIRYKYLPAWGGYAEIIKDNPSDYYHAFCQMIYAMKSLRGTSAFEKERYDTEAVKPYEDRIQQILRKRQLNACDDWKSFGEDLSGMEIPDFDVNQYQQEYVQAEKGHKDDTFLGKFFLAAMSQKSMVSKEIFLSGSLLAGFSIDYAKVGFRGLKDFRKLAEKQKKNKTVTKG